MSVEGTIFEVREFCLHDGPGVRTTIFFKGCPLRCAWCHNPEGLAAEPQLLVNQAACTGCGACRRACPLPSRSNVAPDLQTVFRPADCTACGACVAVCPQGGRRLCGRRVTAEEVAAEALRHKSFFTAYGGGVTFSGGEPLAQIAFLEALAASLRPLHLALETSGFATPETYQRAARSVDLVIQDLKHPDPDAHRRYTGVELAPILANLTWLKASGRPFIARIPLIPCVNDAPDTLEGFAELLAGSSGLVGVELLPYHLTAGAKYALLGRRYEPPFDPSRPLNRDVSAFAARNLPCRVR
jgi:pyruvate formate lyase activating enzyme